MKVIIKRNLKIMIKEKKTKQKQRLYLRAFKWQYVSKVYIKLKCRKIHSLLILCNKIFQCAVYQKNTVSKLQDKA